MTITPSLSELVGAMLARAKHLEDWFAEGHDARTDSDLLRKAASRLMAQGGLVEPLQPSASLEEEDCLEYRLGVAYQVVGNFLDHIGAFDTDGGQALLDYFSNKPDAKDPLPFSAKSLLQAERSEAAPPPPIDDTAVERELRDAAAAMEVFLYGQMCINRYPDQVAKLPVVMRLHKAVNAALEAGAKT